MTDSFSSLSVRRAASTQTQTLRFFDVDLQFETNSRQCRDQFMALYARFHMTAASPLPCEMTRLSRSNRQVVHAGVFGGTTEFDPGATLMLQGVAYPLPDSANAIPMALEAIVDTVFAHVRSHNLFHAAALSDGTAACLILGDSGWGKTTLALALAQQGMGLLSDETGALDGAGRVHPYPRTVRVRPPTSELLGLHGPDGRAQIAYLPWELQGRLMTDRTARLDHLFFLTPSAGQPHTRSSRVHLTGASAQLCRELAHLPGVSHIDRHGVSAVAVTQADAPTSVVDDIREICKRHNALVVNSVAVLSAKPVFPRKPYVERMSVNMALQWLLPHMVGGPVTDVRRRQSGALDLYAALAGIVHSAHCYHVRPGDPHATATELRAIMAANRPPQAQRDMRQIHHPQGGPST